MHCFRALIPACLLWLITDVGTPLAAEERQSHGFAFEQRVWNHLFERGYTDEWDIPARANLANPGFPVSVKYIRWGSPVYLGDAVRQREIDQSFELVVGFYEPDENGNKRTVAIHDILISAEDWNAWWGSVEAAELIDFGTKIQSGTIREARDYARPTAAELRTRSGIFSINPKIDASQRRIQCSIPFVAFYRELVGEEPEPQDTPTLWGSEWSGP